MSFKPVLSSNSDKQNLNQINDMIRQVNREQVTKAFKQPGGNAIIEGKLPYEGGYGFLIDDTSNVHRILIGIAPDGEIDIAASKQGFDITGQY